MESWSRAYLNMKPERGAQITGVSFTIELKIPHLRMTGFQWLGKKDCVFYKKPCFFHVFLMILGCFDTRRQNVLPSSEDVTMLIGGEANVLRGYVQATHL